jgi:hypothetical protein
VIRRLVAGLIVVGLAVGIWALWPREDSDTTPTTLSVAVESTTTATTPVTTTTVAGTTTTSEDGSHVVTTVEEAEAVLRELWFGWFEGIYNQDEERIKEVVGTQAMLDSARQAFESLAFVAPPTSEAITFVESEILLSSETCLAVWSRSDANFLETGDPREGVDVIRREGDSWLFVSSWVHRDDLWEPDCEAELEPLP